MQKKLNRVERIEYIHRRLAFEIWPCPEQATFKRLAKELGVKVVLIHEDIGVMRRELGLPISIDNYPLISYAHLPQFNSDVFDLADILVCHVQE